MALEKKWEEILKRNLVQDGGEDGRIVLESTSGFKVKQRVSLEDNLSSTNRSLEVKRVESSTVLFLGELGKNIKHRIDLSSFTVANNSKISATEQPKNEIPDVEHELAVYEREPTVAKRVVNVDRYGKIYGKSHQEQQQVVEGAITGSVYNNTKLAYNTTLQVEYIGLSPFATLDSENRHYVEKLVYDSVLNVTRVLIATKENINQNITNLTIAPISIGGVDHVDITVNTGKFLELEEINNFGSGAGGAKRFDELMGITVNTSLGLNQTFSGKIVNITDDQNIRVEITSGSAVSETTNITAGDLITKSNGENSSLLNRRWDLRENYVYRVREDE